MAKKKKSRRRGTGSVLQVRQLSGLGAVRRPNTVMGTLIPVAVGGVVTAGTTIGIRALMTPDTEVKSNVMQYAPWIGLAAGGVVSLALWNMTSQAAGMIALATSGALALATVVGESVARMRLTNGAAPQTAGLGAIVPEYSGRRNGVGVVLMERAGTGRPRLGDAQKGANINLGKINTAAFGTPGFVVG